MTPTEIIYDILDDHFAVAPANVHQTIYQLGLDSLDEVELVVRLEEALNKDLKEVQIDSTTTVKALIALAESPNGTN